MELTDLMNPEITFSKTTMDDILARYSVKAAASASTTNMHDSIAAPKPPA
jgi:hypothetical protein